MNVIYVLSTREQAVMGTTADFIYHSGEFLAPLLVALGFGHIGRWTVTDLAFMLAYGTVVAGVLDVFEGVWSLSDHVSRGEMDHFLLQPHPVWLSLLTKQFSPIWNWPVMVLGVSALIWSIGALQLKPSPSWIGLLLMNLIASVTVKSAYMNIWGSLAFWAPRGAERASTVAADLAGEITYPLDTLPSSLKAALVSAVPTGLFAWLPSRALLGLGASFEVWVTPLAAAFLAVLAVLLFRAGMRHYMKTGSRRYVGVGQNG